jgi:ElaB/YqjD/DUF883 family membrane-anchored ribosome-binding protein
MLAWILLLLIYIDRKCAKGGNLMNTQTNEVQSESKTGNAASHTSTAPITNRATDAAHETIDRISGGAAKAEKRVRGAVAEGEEQLKSKSDEARVNTEKAVAQVREYAKRNPLMAAGIAFASGLLVSRIIGR